MYTKTFIILMFLTTSLMSANFDYKERTDILQKGVYKLIKKTESMDSKIKYLQKELKEARANKNKTDRLEYKINELEAKLNSINNQNSLGNSPDVTELNQKIEDLESQIKDNQYAIINNNEKVEKIKENMYSKIDKWTNEPMDETDNNDGKIVITKIIDSSEDKHTPTINNIKEKKKTGFFEKIFSNIRLK